MRVAAVGRPERSMGESVIPAEPPRWADVRARAAELDPATEHVEVLLALVRAALALDGIAGLAAALGTLADGLDDRWHALWPVADEDDPDEPWYARANLLADFAADAAFARALLSTPLVEVRGIGAFSARDIDVAAGLVEADEEERARCQGGLVDGAFAEADAESLLATGEALERAIEAAGRGAAALEREIGGGGGQPLVTLAERLEGVRERFVARAGARLSAASPAADHAAAGAAIHDAAAPAPADEPYAADAAGRGVGETANTPPPPAASLVDHRAVRAALAAVVGYYRRHEPGSPVAVLVARSDALVGRGFFELLGALCPADAGDGSLIARLAAPRPDPLATLLAEGFEAHLAGTGAWPETDAMANEFVDAAADHATGAPTDERRATPPLDSREAVVRALDEVIAFYRVREPSSPVPLVLARARALVPLDFDGVLRALAEVLADTGTAAVTDD